MEHLPVNAVDIGALLVICLSTLRGFHRGLSGELAQLISVTVALILGLYARDPFASWLLANTHLASRSAHALAFALVVTGVIIAAILLGFVFSRIMKIVFEESVDKPGGGFAGFVSGILIVALVFMIVTMWPNEYLNRQFGEESIIGRAVIRWTPTVRDRLGDLPVSKEVNKGIRKSRDL